MYFIKDKKNVLIAALIAAVVFMAVGYAAFATTLNINGKATIDSNWDVEITGITSTHTGTASDKTAPTFTKTTATFDSTLVAPVDSSEYTITVENKGNIDAKLDSYTLTSEDGDTQSPAIAYTKVSQPAEGSTLAAGESTTFVVKATYDSSITEVPSVKSRTVTGTISYVQK